MIYLIITTCIVNKYGIVDNEHRKNRYIECISTLLNLISGDLTIKPIIVENNGLQTSFLNYFGCDVFYTKNNYLNFPNKGVNELLDIKDVIKHYNIQDNDFIIKLTGRYKLLNLDFINTVKNNQDKFDAFIKFFNVCTLNYHTNKDDCVLGLYAIKCKYLNNFSYDCKKSPECEFAMYINDNVEKIMEIKDLNLECCFADNFRILNV